MSQDGSGTTIQVYNSFYPQFGNSIIFNGTISDDMKIGNSHHDYIKSASGVYHFGVMYQGEFLGKIQVVPVLVVDSTIAGLYDTIIPDISTSWTDYVLGDSNPSKSKYDFDFTNGSNFMP